MARPKKQMVISGDTVIPLRDVNCVSTGHVLIDLALGGDFDRKQMGFPLGEITVISGPTRSGKTGLLLEVIANTGENRPDVAVRYMDLERGVNLEQVINQRINPASIIQPEVATVSFFADDCTAFIEACKKEGKSGVYIVDSYPALTSVEGPVKGDELGTGFNTAHIREFNKYLMGVAPLLHAARVALIVVTHDAVEMNRVAFGPATKQKISTSAAYLARLNIKVERVSDIKTTVDGENIRVGAETAIKCLKAQHGRISMKVNYVQYDHHGICPFTTNLTFLHDNPSSGGITRLSEIFELEKKVITPKEWLKTQIRVLREMAYEGSDLEYINTVLRKLNIAVYKTWIDRDELLRKRSLVSTNTPVVRGYSLDDDEVRGEGVS
jgi:RecA/RadA recombinase